MYLLKGELDVVSTIAAPHRHVYKDVVVHIQNEVGI